VGYLLIDHHESSGVTHEYNTSTCKHCGSVIIYKSKPLGGFLRKVRVSIGPYGEHEETGQGFYCTKCYGDICHWCGERATKGGMTGRCITQEQQVELTIARR
jgi:DNA-directed RNA polymerase subunit RPC12/RpoP